MVSHYSRVYAVASREDPLLAEDRTAADVIAILPHGDLEGIRNATLEFTYPS